MDPKTGTIRIASAFSNPGNLLRPGQVKAAEAVKPEALVRYQQSIQTAYREVEDALVDLQRTRQQLDALTRQVEALRATARFARLRFDNGQTSYIEALDAERDLFAAELFLAETRGTLFQSRVNLYNAMRAAGSSRPRS